MEEHLDINPNYHDFYVGFEQDIYKILENILNTNQSKVMLYYTAHLYFYLFKIAQKIDVYISSEKYLSKLRNGLSNSNETELILFKEKIVENFCILCQKSKVEMSNNIKNFIIELILSYLVENCQLIIGNKEQFILKSEKKSMCEDNCESDNMMRRIYLYMDALNHYMIQFTNDISTGKRIWKTIEDTIKNKLENPQQNQLLIEIIITYLFSMSQYLNLDESKCRLIYSTIFEFLCDKLNSSKMKIVVGEAQHVNLHLFYEIIYNYVDILIDEILNERYMQFFARIFIEDCLAEVVNKTIEENEKQLMLRLYDIISKHKEPLKLYISLINNTGKLFNILKEENYFLEEQRETSKKLLMKIYIKLNILLTKYSIFINYDKVNLERDEVLMIISNFSTNIPELIPYYITFFIKFFFFIESHFKIEIDFKHRKNVIIVIFEMLYELTMILNETNISNSVVPSEKNWFEEFVKLAELFYIICRNYSNNCTEDAYLIYRNCCALIKKLIQINNDHFSEDQLYCLLFLVLFVLNMICKFNELTELYIIFNNVYDSFKSSIENPTMKENIDKIYKLIEQNYLIDAFKKMRYYYSKKQGLEKSQDIKDNFRLNKIENENTRQLVSKTLLNLHSKFLNVGCQFSQSIDEIVISKGYQLFVREFSHEMTFRDMNKANKEFDSLTEHSFLVSNRDFEFFANDSIKIAFGNDERKSIMPIEFSEKKETNILKSPFAVSNEITTSQPFEIKLRSVESGEEIENKLSKLNNYAFDDYFKNNEINEIKI